MAGKKAGQKAAPHTLYRAYRPHTFKEVRGQEHVVSVLTAAIEKGAIAHAYLFSGGRGTGKTSIARIFARDIGCTDKDLYEIDAASNRGIDDIRELREGVYSSAFESPYKVYIIDEVHMLTKEAFNALLKTLEEPPSHAVFILATTELHKVPDTIQSRCDTYSFKQPSRELLADTVTAVAKKEGYKLERSAADLIALLGEGSFRDALGVLQKVLTVSPDTTVHVAEVEAVTGAPSGAIVRDLFAALASRDAEQGLRAIESAAEQNMDMRQLLKLLMQRVRAVLLLRFAKDMKESLAQEFSSEEFEQLQEAAGKATHVTSDTLRTLLRAYEEMSYASLPHVPLELAIMDMCAHEEQDEQ